jgi:thioredoxin-related protein
MIKLFLSFLLFTCSFYSFAEKVDFACAIANGEALEGKLAVLYHFHGQYFTATDTFVVRNKELKGIVEVKETGLYRLQLDTFPFLEIILSPKEKHPAFSTSITQLAKGYFEFSASPENTSYRKLIIEKRRFDIFQSDLAERKSYLSQWDKQFDAKSKAFDRELLTYSRLLNAKLDSIKVAYPNTVCATALASLLAIPLKSNSKATDAAYDTELAYYHDHYLDGINFGDSLILNFPAFQERLQTFQFNYVDQSDAGQAYFVERLFDGRAFHSTVRNELTEQLLQDFIGKSFSLALEKLLMLAYDNCSDAATGTNKKMMESIKKLSYGSFAPELNFEAANGVSLSLQKTAQSNKLTLLVFYSTGCYHCGQLLPEIQQLYNQYHDKGFEVYAVCINSSHDDWQTYNISHGYTWKNVFAKGGAYEKAVEDYVIAGTPTFVTIDSKGKIINRFNDVPGIGVLLGRL